MQKLIKEHILSIIGLVIGAIAGYLYWQQVGCASGTCMITSNPINSTVYGSVMGALIFSMFKKQNKKKEVEHEI